MIALLGCGLRPLCFRILLPGSSPHAASEARNCLFKIDHPILHEGVNRGASDAILRDGSILGFLFGQKLRQRLALSVIFRCSEVLTKILQIVAM
jgi:hypothetical protein